jgi:hypothetical protein
MKKIVCSYSSIFVLFTLVFILLFHLPIWCFKSVLFYRGVVYLTTSLLILLIVILFIYLKLKKGNIETMISALIVSFAIHLSIFVVFPVTFDRSVSMYLLNTINNSNGSISKKDLENRLISDYVLESKAVERRINEQSTTGFVENKDNVKLSSKGKAFLEISEIIKKIYSLN